MNPAYVNDHVLSPEQLAHFEEQGYLVLDDVLTPDGVAAMLDECMSAWHREKGPYNPDATWLKNALLVNIHHQSPLVADYYFRGPLVKVVSQLIGPNIKGATSQLTFKMRGNTRPFPWHQDNAYGELDPYNAVTALTALEDNDDETGCLWIIPGSHKRGQLRPREQHSATDKQAQKEVVVEADDAEGVPMPLKAGQCLLFHCWMLHKSEGNHSTDRDRRVLFLRYADADAVEVYNAGEPRLGRLLKGETRFPEVAEFEANL